LTKQSLSSNLYPPINLVNFSEFRKAHDYTTATRHKKIKRREFERRRMSICIQPDRTEVELRAIIDRRPLRSMYHRFTSSILLRLSCLRFIPAHNQPANHQDWIPPRPRRPPTPDARSASDSRLGSGETSSVASGSSKQPEMQTTCWSSLNTLSGLSRYSPISTRIRISNRYSTCTCAGKSATSPCTGSLGKRMMSAKSSGPT